MVPVIHYLFERENHAQFSNRGFQILIVGAVLECFAILSIVLRLYVRIRLVRVVALDDVAILLGLLCASAVTGLYIRAVIFGLGGQLQDIATENLAGLLQALFVAKILYHPALLFIKSSIIFFILRLTPFPGYRRILWCTLVITGLYLIGATIVTSLQCHSLDLKRPTSGICINESIATVINFITSGVNIFTDIMLVVFPIPLLWNAPVPKRKKNIVRFVLSLGVFVTAAATIRLIYTILDQPRLEITHKIDYMIWTIVELHVGIIVVNIPAYAPLVKSHMNQQQQRKRSNAGPLKVDPKHRTFRLRVVQNTTVDVHVNMVRPGTKSSDGKAEWDRHSADAKDSSVYFGEVDSSRVNIYVGHGSPSQSQDDITELPEPPRPVYFHSNELSDSWPLPPTGDAWPLPPLRPRKNSNFSMDESRLDF